MRDEEIEQEYKVPTTNSSVVMNQSEWFEESISWKNRTGFGGCNCVQIDYGHGVQRNR